MKNIVYYLGNVRIPDFDVSAGLFRLALTDIRMKDIAVPTVKVDFLDESATTNL